MDADMKMDITKVTGLSQPCADQAGHGYAVVESVERLTSAAVGYGALAAAVMALIAWFA